MKLNCDLGESFGPWHKGNDQQIMPLIDLANIACGFHASDPLTMQKTVQLAVKHDVTIGAHPGYPDLIGFGRRSMSYSTKELTAIFHYQIGALQAICVSQNTKISYVKPHGALYNDMMVNQEIFITLCDALSQLDKTLPLMVQALPETSFFKKTAEKFGLTLWFEAFADRKYNDNGLLVSRENINAVIHNEEQVIDQCKHLLQHGELISMNGKLLNIHVDSLCVHGDNPAAIELVKGLNIMLKQHALKTNC
ncbi:MAG: 5-oxoprolinase subunit PxpA [Colwellia sp.]|nr:5-oxoprolinase subunit PxpA [Colwellia sp.]